MEHCVHRHLNFKEINRFMCFFKKTINWLCLINDDFNKDCTIHKVLLDNERLLEIETYEQKKMESFLKFAKKREEVFSFMYDFYSFAEK